MTLATLPVPSLSITVGGYLNGSLADGSTYQQERMSIYALRDGDLFFYVGRSELTLRRLEQHIGSIYDRANVSEVGWLIRDNLPNSLSWGIDLYMPQDWGCLNYDAPGAENRAIKALRPCLNVAMNPDPRSLPARYRKEEANWRKQIDGRMQTLNMDELRRKLIAR